MLIRIFDDFTGTKQDQLARKTQFKNTSFMTNYEQNNLQTIA